MRVDEHTIELAGSPVFYRTRRGPRAHPPLYLHGIPTSSDDWIPFLERTGGIAPDLLGFGRSGKGGHLDYSLDGLADFVERFLDELEVERVEARRARLGRRRRAASSPQRHPDRVERLVLLNAVPLLAGFQLAPARRALWRRPVIGELADGLDRRSGCSRARSRRSDQRRGVARRSGSTRSGTSSTRARSARSCACYRDADEPTLAQAGAGLDELRDAGARDLGRARPVARRPAARRAPTHARSRARTSERVADAGHWPWLDRTPDAASTRRRGDCLHGRP